MKRFNIYKKCLQSITSSKRPNEVLHKGEEIVLDSKKLTPDPDRDKQIDTPPAKRAFRSTKSLRQLCNKPQISRRDDIWHQIQDFADTNDETPLMILGLLLKRCELAKRIHNNFSLCIHFYVVPLYNYLIFV